MFTEQQIALTRNLEPCGWWDKDAWCRGIIDVGVKAKDTVLLADYKTGKGYGYDRNGYGQYGYQGQADARFNCTIDRYGRITDIDAKRNYSGAYPYRRY